MPVSRKKENIHPQTVIHECMKNKPLRTLQLLRTLQTDIFAYLLQLVKERLTTILHYVSSHQTTNTADLEFGYSTCLCAEFQAVADTTAFWRHFTCFSKDLLIIKKTNLTVFIVYAYQTSYNIHTANQLRSISVDKKESNTQIHPACPLISKKHNNVPHLHKWA